MRISTQKDDPGYDPEIHENKLLKITCNGLHIKTAHTADTDAGEVHYYQRDENGRMKTKIAHGKVEIKGL
jgi:hypothetical protein